MVHVFQHLYEEIMNDLKNLKTDKDEDQVVFDNLIRMSNSLSCVIYNKIINMNFSTKVEVMKEYRQSVMNSETVDFFKSVIENFLKFKVSTMAVVYENETKLLSDMLPAQLRDQNVL